MIHALEGLHTEDAVEDHCRAVGPCYIPGVITLNNQRSRRGIRLEHPLRTQVVQVQAPLLHRRQPAFRALSLTWAATAPVKCAKVFQTRNQQFVARPTCEG